MTYFWKTEDKEIKLLDFWDSQRQTKGNVFKNKSNNNKNKREEKKGREGILNYIIIKQLIHTDIQTCVMDLNVDIASKKGFSATPTNPVVIHSFPHTELSRPPSFIHRVWENNPFAAMAFVQYHLHF